MNPTVKNAARIGAKLFAISTVARQVGKARQTGDMLRLLDALANALAILTAIAILVREIRDSRQPDEVLEEAPL